MADEPIIAPSALKHGLTEEEILHAYRNPIRAWDPGEGFTMLVGPTAAALFVEIGYIETVNDTASNPDIVVAVVIVHAMRARDKFVR